MNPSASALDRAMACPASCVLPQAKSGVATAAGERGTVAHRYIELVIEGRGGEAYATCPAEHLEWCSRFDVESWLAGVA